jgi:hypothetical protein
MYIAGEGLNRPQHRDHPWSIVLLTTHIMEKIYYLKRGLAWLLPLDIISNYAVCALFKVTVKNLNYRPDLSLDSFPVCHQFYYFQLLRFIYNVFKRSHLQDAEKIPCIHNLM